MSTSVPSADAKAVVRAIEALSTQLRRGVDAYLTPVVEVADATADDATTPATTCSALHTGFPGDHRQCIRAAQHHGDHIDEQGFHWSDTVAVYPVDPGVVREALPTDDGPRCVCGDPIELAGDPAVWRHRPGGAYGLDAHTARPPDWLTPTRCEHRGPHPGFTCAEVDASQPYFRVRWEQEQQVPAADEDALRAARRHSIRVLLNRLNNGLPLGSEEAQLLTRHVAAEICEANDGRKRAEQAEERLSRIRNMADAWEHQLPDTIRTATAAEAVRLAVDGDYRPVMFGVTPARPDPEMEETQAANERVRGALHEVLAKFAVGAAYGERPTYTVPGDVDKETFDRWFAALDGTEQPTTE
ncbi:MAG: hypothetical protein HOV70_31705, partial [Streptomyces sp.]|nr:hypothetical protein [Streptomyces sp.]